MKILSLESSAVSAAVCLTEDERVLASAFQNCGLTHSRTLLPMCEQVLSWAGVAPDGVDAFAVAHGPGSFTGVRIGVATVKGLAFGADKPCIGVSTLEAMAHGLTGLAGTVSCVMDARAGQVYHARFTLADGQVIRRCEDRAISLEALAAEIGENREILVGDGADLCYTRLIERCPQLVLAPPHLRFPSAYGVARAALPRLLAGEGVSAGALNAQYLRRPQAEQQRMKQNRPNEAEETKA